MTTQLRRFWQFLVGQSDDDAPSVTAGIYEPPAEKSLALEISPNDPLIPFFQTTQGVVEVDRLNLDSPALKALREAGVKITIPLVSQGELIGLLNLGPRLSEQEYSADDRRLLSNLAIQAAPALRVAQLVRQQEVEARQRERIEQELRVARIIQQTLLPKKLPELPGYRVAAYYQPARDVGGDFYDFVELPDGQIGLFIGDVTDKGVPAALVMASTRSILRGAAERISSPGEVLQRANDMLVGDIPPNMFATCLYAVLDPESGRIRFANAGHNLPYRSSPGGVDEMRATGMPLGLLPGMTYEEHVFTLSPGESLLLSSDGLVEAHNLTREMFGFPRVRALMAEHPGGAALIEHLMGELSSFTGPEYEQEDDITLVSLERLATGISGEGQETNASNPNPVETWEKLAEFSLSSQPGNERQAIQKVVEAVQSLNLPSSRLERLKTAVSEATMNAMEHGNKYQADKPVAIQVNLSDRSLSVCITDQGGRGDIPEPEEPDLEAKLAGEQTPRGWGLFLIKNMVDELNVDRTEDTHTVELVLYLKGGEDATV